MTELSMYRGDTKSWPFTIEVNGVALNITGASFWFTAKNKISDADVDAVFQKTVGDGITITSASEGKIEVKLAEGDTNTLTKRKRLHFDLQMKEASGDVSTPMAGVLVVDLDVTRSTS